MATTPLPKYLTPFPYNSPNHTGHKPVTKISFLNPSDHSPSLKRSILVPKAKKKNTWLDPFDDGEDPDMEYGSMFADGKQDEDPRLPDDPDSQYGFLKFPAGFSVEVASLGLKIRGDVRRCCCVVSGGVYENLLFFPVIQLIKDRYPSKTGQLIDIDVEAVTAALKVFDAAAPALV